MDLKEKNRYKDAFKHDLRKFADKLVSYVSTEGGEWSVKGFIDVYKNIYTISSDTKIVSKILEIHIFPQILQFAKEAGYKIVLAEKQNWYPDLTFIHEANSSVKFALDIKTTFRRNHNTAGFTLGSHGGYFKERDKNKNIQFPYNEYLGHFCLGVIYTRAEGDDLSDTDIYQVQELQEEYETPQKKVGSREVTTVKNLTSITSVIKNFDFFVAEKWKIASDAQGSGNTANIGSVTDIEALKNESGVFSNLGEEWFDEYWMNYGVATMLKGERPVKITTLKDFLLFKGRPDLIDQIVTKNRAKK
ncbi:MAG: EcoRV family type II restriction endonuclease [Bacteroidetes bacterium]|nr:EcoRV family type II restriction endonuclease [Bacteroidota bacterium]